MQTWCSFLGDSYQQAVHVCLCREIHGIWMQGQGTTWYRALGRPIMARNQHGARGIKPCWNHSKSLAVVWVEEPPGSPSDSQDLVQQGTGVPLQWVRNLDRHRCQWLWAKDYVTREPLLSGLSKLKQTKRTTASISSEPLFQVQRFPFSMS